MCRTFRDAGGPLAGFLLLPGSAPAYARTARWYLTATAAAAITTYPATGATCQPHRAPKGGSSPLPIWAPACGTKACWAMTDWLLATAVGNSKSNFMMMPLVCCDWRWHCARSGKLTTLLSCSFDSCCSSGMAPRTILWQHRLGLTRLYRARSGPEHQQHHG